MSITLRLSQRAFRNRSTVLSALHLNLRDDKQFDHSKQSSLPLQTSPIFQTRQYSSSTPANSIAIAGALVSVAVVAQGARYGVEAYNEWQARAPEEAAEESAGESAEAGEAPKAKGGKKEKRENFFNQFGFSGPSKYYEGGFEDEMTRAEASLILGVRESASAKRIKDAHRTILIANHPDTGGSNFIASKVNEAKELLLKGKEKA